ncbi:MAG: methylenetetrahydrofolate reductase C-terminal domain-containing protein [Candidatus Promineifilaceae bacterium]|nr:methylenetetrahydrofolate reductase C-terminal domain-containing protein [Candidatus Promineifilaceae bacterium]
MLRFLQNYPHALELMYDAFERALQPFQRWLKPGSALEPAVTWIERVSKEAIFDCRMCGQCILHSTGMTCSMTCPKNLRNGPCGGVRLNGNCEVKPDMPCIWVQAYERSLDMPRYGADLIHVQPPVNRKLEETSSWINMLHEIDSEVPKGWVEVNDIPIITSDTDLQREKSPEKIPDQATA